MPSHVAAGPVHHLRLTVTDIQRSRQFYTSLLGFQVAVESPPPGDPSEAETFRILFGGVVMVRGDLLMGLRPMAPGQPRLVLQRTDDPRPAKNTLHLDLHVPSVDDLPAAVDRAVGLGATVVAEVEQDGQTWRTLADPEGNVFCLVAD